MWIAFTMSELKQALRSTAGTAPGPSQWSADDILRAPGDALQRLLDLSNMTKDAGRWPKFLCFQEVSMISNRLPPRISALLG